MADYQAIALCTFVLDHSLVPMLLEPHMSRIKNSFYIVLKRCMQFPIIVPIAQLKRIAKGVTKEFKFKKLLGQYIQD